MEFLSVEFFFIFKLINDELWIIIVIKIDYGVKNKLYSVFCLNNKEIWMYGYDKILRFYSMYGILFKFIKIKLGN